MSGPYQGRDLSNCGIGRLHVAINCGVLSVKPPFEGVTGHPQNTLTIGGESLKGVLCKFLHYNNSQLYVIVSDF